MNQNPMSILLVEDERAHAAAIQRAFENAGKRAVISVAGTLGEFRRIAAESPPDIAVMDLNLPDGRAVEVLVYPPENGPFPILLMTSYGSEHVAVEAIKSGAIDYIVKSAEAFVEMPRTVERALREWNLIRERSRNEALMRAAEIRFRSYFELGMIGLAEISPDKRWVRVNGALCSMFGYSEEELLATTCEKIAYPEDVPACLAQFERLLSGEQDVYSLEKRFVRKDGGIVHTIFSVRGVRRPDRSIDYVVASLQDITDRKLLESQLLQSQKMEAIGQLAGGIAHDLNNILMVIYGYCSALQMKMEKDSPVRSDVDHIYAAAERAANLTRSLLAFSRKQIMAPKIFDLNETVMNIGKLLIRIIGEDIHFKTVSSGKPLTILADSGQIEQVLMNLATNARDAMPDGGLLTIETESREIDESFVNAQGYGAPGRYALISVSDTGKGMDNDTAKRIFEPFFTTKEVGKGTGLGLAIVYGVIKQHNGFINVQSEPDKGTSFRIYLPQVYGDKIDDSAMGNVSEYPLKGRETVLFAEDDPFIRQLTEMILIKFGYEVILAHDGIDVIDKFKANRDKVDLIIMDMIMPRKSGLEAYREIRKISPAARVLFISGYSPDLLRNKGFLEGIEEVIIKPVQPMELARRVRAMLDRPQTENAFSPDLSDFQGNGTGNL
jgi:PAS domain S-box-containing protein